MTGLFSDCPKLENINFSNFNTANVANMTDMFYECSDLDNNTLNEILRICTNATNLDEEHCDKTLSAIGLTEEQATTCQSLSNYQDFIDAGWTTGY